MAVPCPQSYILRVQGDAMTSGLYTEEPIRYRSQWTTGTEAPLYPEELEPSQEMAYNWCRVSGP